MFPLVSLKDLYFRPASNSLFRLLYLKISLIRMLALLLMSFVNIKSIRSSLIHLYGLQLLVLQSLFVEINSFICTNRINLLCLRSSLGRLVIIVKEFLKLPKLLLLTKQASLASPRNLVLINFDKLHVAFSTRYVCYSFSILWS